MCDIRPKQLIDSAVQISVSQMSQDLQSHCLFQTPQVDDTGEISHYCDLCPKELIDSESLNTNNHMYIQSKVLGNVIFVPINVPQVSEHSHLPGTKLNECLHAFM